MAMIYPPPEEPTPAPEETPRESPEMMAGSQLEGQIQEDRPPEPAPSIPARDLQPLSPQDERTWAMLAHLSVLLNLVTGVLGPVAALIIYLVYKDRSRYVAYQSMQSFVFQLVWWVGAGALIGLIWAVTGLLSAVLVGLICIPFAVLATIVLAIAPLGALIYGVIAAIQVSQGQPFEYWLVGDWVRSTLTNP